MKLNATHAPIAVCGIVLALLFLPRSVAQESHQEEEQTELDLCMERIEDAVKAVRRNLKDEAGRPEALRKVLELELATVEARGFVPQLAGKVPEVERAAFVSDFRRMMIDFQRAELDLEAALLDGDAGAIQAAFDAVRAFEDRGHERFTEDED